MVKYVYVTRNLSRPWRVCLRTQQNIIFRQAWKIFSCFSSVDTFSKAAIVELQQSINYRDTLNTVNRTGAFRVASAAINDVLSCLLFWVFYCENWLQTFSTFFSSCRRKPQRAVVITDSKDCHFLYTWWTFVPYYKVSVAVFLVFSFHGISELRGGGGGWVAIDEPPRGSANGPVSHPWNSAR
jgi:hypothetical protein